MICKSRSLTINGGAVTSMLQSRNARMSSPSMSRVFEKRMGRLPKRMETLLRQWGSLSIIKPWSYLLRNPNPILLLPINPSSRYIQWQSLSSNYSVSTTRLGRRRSRRRTPTLYPNPLIMDHASSIILKPSNFRYHCPPIVQVSVQRKQTGRNGNQQNAGTQVVVANLPKF